MIDIFSIFYSCFSLLIVFVIYLLLPKGIRVHYFGSYPKRYAWSKKNQSFSPSLLRPPPHHHVYTIPTPSVTGGSSIITTGTKSSTHTNNNPHHRHLSTQGLPPPTQQQQQQQSSYYNSNNNHSIQAQQALQVQPRSQPQSKNETNEMLVSTTMHQLRDAGLLLIAHGSKGKPKSVRLQLNESNITWRTESKSKIGKIHSVPLQHIMYVDVGKQTTALRRVENAAVLNSHCFSLLTKDGSLDLECESETERDALVNCFSLVLDEVHAQKNWRDVFSTGGRGPSSDMPSSFDDFEVDPNGVIST